MTSRSTIVKGLEVNTNYTLFLAAYQEYMCSLQPFLLWTSEPFYLPSVRMSKFIYNWLLKNSYLLDDGVLKIKIHRHTPLMQA